MSHYVFQVADLRIKLAEDAHGGRLKLYHDSILDTVAILHHAVQYEAGTPVRRLMHVEDRDEGMMDHVRWCGLPRDLWKPIKKLHEDVPQLLGKLFMRRNAPHHLLCKALQVLGF